MMIELLNCMPSGCISPEVTFSVLVAGFLALGTGAALLIIYKSKKK